MLDEDLPPGVRCYLKAGYTAELTDPLIGAIVQHIAASPSASSTFDFHHMGDAVARVADDATAFGDRRSAFCFNIVGVWHFPSDDGINRDWYARSPQRWSPSELAASMSTSPPNAAP